MYTHDLWHWMSTCRKYITSTMYSTEQLRTASCAGHLRREALYHVLLLSSNMTGTMSHTHYEYSFLNASGVGYVDARHKHNLTARRALGHLRQYYAAVQGAKWLPWIATQ